MGINRYTGFDKHYFHSYHNMNNLSFVIDFILHFHQNFIHILPQLMKPVEI